MNFFTNRFSPKRSSSRSISTNNKSVSLDTLEKDLGLDKGPIEISLGNFKASFDRGVWITETKKSNETFKENEKLKKEIKKLEEENNLLKLKFDLILDMLTETTLEAQMHRKEMENLKNQLCYNKRLTIH